MHICRHSFKILMDYFQWYISWKVTGPTFRLSSSLMPTFWPIFKIMGKSHKYIVWIWSWYQPMGSDRNSACGEWNRRSWIWKIDIEWWRHVLILLASIMHSPIYNHGERYFPQILISSCGKEIWSLPTPFNKSQNVTFYHFIVFTPV